MIMEKYITQNGIKYELIGEQYYPMLEITERKEHKIGKYGLLHRDYIKQHKRGTYTTLLTEGKLNAYLHEIDVQANEMVEAFNSSSMPRSRARLATMASTISLACTSIS